VLVSSARGGREWTTVGVHPNVIEASWQALVDALVYALGQGSPDVGAGFDRAIGQSPADSRAGLTGAGAL